MSDLKSSELTQEERALWDAIMVREQKYIGPDDECPYSKVDWWAEKCILARRRLFAPPASRESDYYCRKCHKVLMVGENHFIAEANQYVCGPWDYSRKSPAKEESNMGTGEFVTDERGAWEKCSRPDCDLRVISRGKAVCGYGCHEPASEEKVECPNCGDGITAIDNHQKQKALVGGGQITVYTCQPAQPELGSEAFDKRVRAGAAKIALGSAGFSQPEPAAPASEEKVTCECGKFECWECRNRPAQPEPAATKGMAGVCYSVDGERWHEPGTCPHCTEPTTLLLCANCHQPVEHLGSHLSMGYVRDGESRGEHWTCEAPEVEEEPVAPGELPEAVIVRCPCCNAGLPELCYRRDAAQPVTPGEMPEATKLSRLLSMVAEYIHNLQRDEDWEGACAWTAALEEAQEELAAQPAPSPVAMTDGEPQWGIERTETHNWIGPLRHDGKIDPIVCDTDRGGEYTKEYSERNDRHAELIVAAVNSFTSQPAAPSEMPEAVSAAVKILRTEAYEEVYTATELEEAAMNLESLSWFRAHAQPVGTDELAEMFRKGYESGQWQERHDRKNATQPVPPPLAMSEELERVLQRAEEDARTCWQTKAPGRLADIAAVRQQATAPKVVKTPRVPVDSIRCLLARGSWPDRDDESYTAQKNAVAWLAELDAHEGRKP